MFKVFNTTTGRTVYFTQAQPDHATLPRTLDYDAAHGFFVVGMRGKVAGRYETREEAQRMANFENMTHDYDSFRVVAA